MDYHDAANFLFDLQRFGPKPGPESTADLLAQVGSPHEGVPAVQIAGSNGKGSTARMTERILRETGLSVGLFTSPHLDDMRERIRVDGRKIPKATVCEFVDETAAYITERGADGASPTFFEATTAMALWHFAREDVDVAVLEVGIGGSIDATSVVDPIASAVTTVTLEHTDLLGETIEEIAGDKAQVAPADRPLVTGATGDALAAVREVAGDVVTVGPNGDVVPEYEGRTNGIEAGVRIDASPDLGGWSVDGRIPTVGAHQAENAAVAATLARQVTEDLDGTPLPTETIARGLRQAHWPGRFELLERSPTVVLDGAHNPGACERLADAIGEFSFEDLHLVFGALHDKDHGEMMRALPTPTSVTTCEPDTGRAADAAVIARVFERDGASVRTVDAVPDAVDAAIETAGPEDLVLVTGSLYTVGEARARWRRPRIPKRIESIEDARSALRGTHVPDAQIEKLQASGVHRVVKTRLRHRQLERLRGEFRRIGGECAVSGTTDGTDAAVDVLLSGTLAQFRTLVSVLDEEPFGLASFADELRSTLGIETDDTAGSPSYGDTVTATGPSSLPWDDDPAIMGILNVTPDSFHDGGEYDRVEDAVRRAESMVDAGATIVDVGGESTRPGADPVPVETEIDRVVPVIEELNDLDAAISVDTRKAAVADAALAAGADIVNDVSGLEDPDIRFVAAEHDAGLVVMHSIDAPVDPEADPTYDDVVEDVIDELAERVLLAEKAGVDRDRILVDPGLGFGKRAAESFELLDRLDELHALGCPVMVGHSHKSMFELPGYEHGGRLEPTVAATTVAAERGADVIRVHDVPENVAAIRVSECAANPFARSDQE